MGKYACLSIVFVSLLSYLCELILTCLCIYYLYTQHQLVIVSVVIGILAITSTVIQILSWLFQRLRSAPFSMISLLIHILYGSLIWRYIRILSVHRVKLTRRELWETFTLRTLHAMTSSVIILSIISYLLISDPDTWMTWYIISSVCILLFSCSWGVTCYKKHLDYCCVSGAVYPGISIVFIFIWRLGEIICRVLTLIMFIQVQGYWVFLVIGGHWITMLVLIIVESILRDDANKDSKAKLISQAIIKSYCYIFCHLNIAGKKTKFGTAIYYSITCLESIALLTLWIIYDQRKELHIPLALLACISCAVGSSFAALYYACLHHRTGVCSSNKDSLCATECVDCHQKSCGVSTTPSEETDFPQQDWEEFIDRAACASAANRLRNHNEPLTQEPQQNAIYNVPQLRTNGPRSETPLVLMGYENPSAKRTISHSRANSLDFLWDNYDLQVTDHFHGSETFELRDISTRPKQKRQRTWDGILDTHGTDQGYYSGISSSSKENNRKAAMASFLERNPVHSLYNFHGTVDRLNCRARDGTLSDGNTSSYSTTSSKKAVVNCGRCGNSLSLDHPTIAPSMYSIASSTSVASSAPSHYPRRRASIHVMDRGYYNRRRRRRLMDQAMFGADEAETLEQAVARIHGARGYKQQVLSSDVTSSAWEYTDSEI